MLNLFVSKPFQISVVPTCPNIGGVYTSLLDHCWFQWWFLLWGTISNLQVDRSLLTAHGAKHTKNFKRAGRCGAGSPNKNVELTNLTTSGMLWRTPALLVALLHEDQALCSCMAGRIIRVAHSTALMLSTTEWFSTNSFAYLGRNRLKDINKVKWTKHRVGTMWTSYRTWPFVSIAQWRPS